MGINVLIVGKGVVGTNLYNDLIKVKPDTIDKFHPERNEKKYTHYHIAFICVDTPYTDKRPYCDISEVINAVNENKADCYVIKSTVLPGTTDYISTTYNKKVIFSPEYYGGTQHCNNFDFNFTILGGDKETASKVQELYQYIYDARHRFYYTDAKTAELVKYMENSWLATKVSFCCQFKETADKIGVNYNELRELFCLDSRVNPSHTFVYEDHPYWDSHCLNKDVPAIANTYDMELLKSVISYNERAKNKYGKH